MSIFHRKRAGVLVVRFGCYFHAQADQATDEIQLDTDKDDVRRTTHLGFICGRQSSR